MIKSLFAQSVPEEMGGEVLLSPNYSAEIPGWGISGQGPRIPTYSSMTQKGVLLNVPQRPESDRVPKRKSPIVRQPSVNLSLPNISEPDPNFLLARKFQGSSQYQPLTLIV